MRKIIFRSMTLLTLLAVLVATLAVLLVQRQGAAKSRDVKQTKQEKLREIAMKRDVEVQGPSGCDLGDTSLANLKSESGAIVYGRITGSSSFFDESSPSEAGDYITTEYTVEVLRVLKDTTLESMPPPHKAPPVPLTTPLKIARNGGVVNVNGHCATVKVKDYEDLGPGKEYVFFLNWSPDYRAYKLTNCIFGAIMVNEDLSLRSLGSSKEFKAQLHDMNLESLFRQIQ